MSRPKPLGPLRSLTRLGVRACGATRCNVKVPEAARAGEEKQQPKQSCVKRTQSRAASSLANSGRWERAACAEEAELGWQATAFLPPTSSERYSRHQSPQREHLKSATTSVMSHTRTVERGKSRNFVDTTVEPLSLVWPFFSSPGRVTGS